MNTRTRKGLCATGLYIIGRSVTPDWKNFGWDFQVRKADHILTRHICADLGYVNVGFSLFESVYIVHWTTCNLICVQYSSWTRPRYHSPSHLSRVFMHMKTMTKANKTWKIFCQNTGFLDARTTRTTLENSQNITSNQSGGDRQWGGTLSVRILTACAYHEQVLADQVITTESAPNHHSWNTPGCTKMNEVGR